ncbi:alpha/beta hydrolase [Dactylosporangium sp. NPDC050588]|uniref:alpha/beta fold hydrolase n=1 Tax=Dactylosporangium sp. NPDC050588 TaxID=3157211 RepID=UPI0033CA4080
MNRLRVVLVHGAGRGAWCWQRLTPLLDAAGVEWEAPTLTGLADRAHLLGPEVGLQTHVDDVRAVLARQAPAAVCLVGHSYGAVVVAGVVGAGPEHVARVVLLDGPVVEDGESGADVHPKGAAIRARARRHGDTDIIPIAGGPDDRLSPADNAWIAGSVTPQPLRCVTDPVRLPGGWPLDLPKDYVLCGRPGESSDRPYLSRVRSGEGWSTHVVDSPHDVMIARPDWLAELLVRLSANPIDDSRRPCP